MLFITGAAGFVGRNLLIKLTTRGIKVRCLVRDKRKIRENYGVEIAEGNINDADILFKAIRDVNTVIHLAAVVKSSDPGEFINVNVNGTKNLVSACIRNGVRKIIYVSSLDAGLNGANMYGKTKRIGEDIIKDSNIDYLILRPALIYGKDSRDIKILIEMIKKYPIIPVVGNGKGKLQPVYIEDICDIIIKLIDSNIKNKIYYIAGGERISMNDLIDRIAYLFSKSVIKIHIPLWLLRPTLKLYNLVIRSSSINYESMKLLSQDKVCDIDEIKKDFNFKPIGLDEGLKLILQNSGEAQ